MPHVQYITIDSERAGQRLDNFLCFTLKGAPKSLIYKIIRKGEVRINKGRAKPDQKLLAGDLVRVPPLRLADKAPPPKPSSQLRDILAKAILFDKPELMVVNKPSGLAVHGGSGVNLGLIESLRQMFPEYRSLELVHRLDRDTSGCVMVAKKRSCLRYLQDLLREEGKAEGKIQKCYLALVQGQWPKRKSLVNAPLLKNEPEGGERIVKVHLDGKPSRTRFSILKNYSECTLVQVTPITGRTHQIRVHAQHMGHPLVGDEKYGHNTFNQQMRRLGFKRLFLHAQSLRFRLPDGEELFVEAPPPEELTHALSQLK